MNVRKNISGILIGIFSFSILLEAKQISAETDVEWMVQAERFLRMEDPSIQRVIIGCLLMGVSCGLILSGYVINNKTTFFRCIVSFVIQLE